MITPGIHQQILGRLKEANWLEPCSVEEVEEALSHPDHHQRATISIQLIRKIWRSFPGLGVPPALEEVLRLEQEGAFWDRQRDHIVHTLEVYLLGLDLIAGLPTLRERLSKSIGFPELRRRWVVASLAHDQGYVFEVEGAHTIPQAVRTLLRSPLKALDRFSASALTSMAQIVMTTAEDFDFLAHLDTIVRAPDKDPEDLLDRLEKRCGALNLATGDHQIRDYYQFAQQHGRLYNDHGISGVLLLLHLHRVLAKQVASLEPRIPRLTLTGPERADLKGLARSLLDAEDSIEEGALAIALHNISKDVWNGQELAVAVERGLRLAEYSLSLTSVPLAWFLGFVDTLQTWNRPLARLGAAIPGQYTDPADVSLEYADNRAFLAYANEDAHLRATGESLFWKRRQALVHFLRPEEVDEYLAIGPVARTAPGRSDPPGHLPRCNYNVLGVVTSGIAGDRMAELRTVPRLFPAYKPVCVLYTGGSVGMIREDPDDPRSPLITVKQVEPILSHLKRLNELPFDIDFYRTDTILDSSNMLPSNWTELAQIVAACYAYYQGFVILHGTDTMTYTASALSFFFRNLAKPVIITGAERPISEIGNDAERNIMTALQLAAPYSLAMRPVPEVCIYFGTKLLRGNRAKKLHALAFEGFDSPNSERLAVVEDKIDLSTRVIRDSILDTDEARRPEFAVETTLDDQVGIFEIYPSAWPGSCFETLQSMLASPNIRGLILKTYGTGNAPTVPKDFLTYIEQAVKADKVIINLTHCPQGQVEVRLFETNARLFELGVINGGDMTVEAAYTKLMWLLGKYSIGDGLVDIQAVKRDLQVDLRGELRYSTYNLVYRDTVVPIGKQFIGAIDNIGAFEAREISHAYVRLHDIDLYPNPPQTEFTLSVYCNYPRLRQGISEADHDKHFVGEARRQWSGSKITCNLDATEVVRRVRWRKDEPMSLQVVAKADFEVRIATLQLAIFTENVKGN